MKTRTICLAVIIGWLGAIPWHFAEAGTSFSVGISITQVSDFYAPLQPYGHWVTVPTYGRCWYPAYVSADWQPYATGHWEWTDQGWYWVSDEPWAWATYHYGRWVYHPYYGWLWVPDTVWGPAWVAWREGGGYYGWAPLPPRMFCDAGGFVIWERVSWYPRAFVFVEFGRFCHPIHYRHHWHHRGGCHPAFHQTVNITNIQIINNTTVIHRGPRVESVERHTGRHMEARSSSDLWRQRSEQVVQRASLDRVTPPPFVRPSTTTLRGNDSSQRSSEQHRPESRVSVAEPRRGEQMRGNSSQASRQERTESSTPRAEPRREAPSQQPSSRPAPPRFGPSQTRPESVARAPEARPEPPRRPSEPARVVEAPRPPQQFTRSEPPSGPRSFALPARQEPPRQERQESRGDSQSSERSSSGAWGSPGRGEPRGNDRFGGSPGFNNAGRGFGPPGRR